MLSPAERSARARLGGLVVHALHDSRSGPALRRQRPPRRWRGMSGGYRPRSPIPPSASGVPGFSGRRTSPRCSFGPLGHVVRSGHHDRADRPGGRVAAPHTRPTAVFRCASLIQPSSNALPPCSEAVDAMRRHEQQRRRPAEPTPLNSHLTTGTEPEGTPALHLSRDVGGAT